jgi:hypothetical protein
LYCRLLSILPVTDGSFDALQIAQTDAARQIGLTLVSASAARLADDGDIVPPYTSDHLAAVTLALLAQAPWQSYTDAVCRMDKETCMIR